MSNDELVLSCEPPVDDSLLRCIVRLSTSMWADHRGIYRKQSLTYLKRQSTCYELLKEEVDNVGVAETFPLILNLHECPDGVYQVVTCNLKRDWETGMVDEYDFRLVPLLQAGQEQAKEKR